MKSNKEKNDFTAKDVIDYAHKHGIMVRSRKVEILDQRKYVFFLLHDIKGYSYERICKALHQKNHTNVRHNAIQVPNLFQTNAAFRKNTEAIRNRFQVDPKVFVIVNKQILTKAQVSLTGIELNKVRKIMEAYDLKTYNQGIKKMIKLFQL